MRLLCKPASLGQTLLGNCAAHPQVGVHRTDGAELACYGLLESTSQKCMYASNLNRCWRCKCTTATSKLCNTELMGQNCMTAFCRVAIFPNDIMAHETKADLCNSASLDSCCVAFASCCAATCALARRPCLHMQSRLKCHTMPSSQLQVCTCEALSVLLQ